jgi:outer membrane protein assembly factor BamB
VVARSSCPRSSFLRSSSLCFGFLVALASVADRTRATEDWPRFRGVNGSGLSSSRGLPVEFGPKKNVVWRVDALPGTSSPILSGGHLYYSSFKGDERTLTCLDAATGKRLWSRSVKKARTENATPPNGPATPTPVSDGANVFVLYPDVGLICYSSSGDEKWKADLGPFRTVYGLASSLVTVDGLVIVVVDQAADSYIAAFQADSGKRVWKSVRVDGMFGGYSTPCLFKPPLGTTQLVVPGPLEVVGYDPATGKRLWWVNGVTNAPIAVPVIWRDRAFVCEELGEPLPFSMLAKRDTNKDGKISLDEVKSSVPMTRLVERIDKNFGNHQGIIGPAEWDKAWATMTGIGGLVSLRLDGAGDVTKTNIGWNYKKGMPLIPSPVIYDDLVYVVRDGGILSAFEAATGKRVKQGRVESHGRQYYASPIAADGKIFLLDTEGNLTVVKAGRDWTPLATNELGEACWATPAISDGHLYVRTDKSIYSFAGPSRMGATTAKPTSAYAK